MMPRVVLLRCSGNSLLAGLPTKDAALCGTRACTVLSIAAAAFTEPWLAILPAAAALRLTTIDKLISVSATGHTYVFLAGRWLVPIPSCITQRPSSRVATATCYGDMDLLNHEHLMLIVGVEGRTRKVFTSIQPLLPRCS